MPTMERISMEEYNRRMRAASNQHLCQFKPVPLHIQSSAVRTTNVHRNVLHNDDADDDDDSDEEMGAYIYSISRTAQLREEAAVRNNETLTNNDDNITRPKRKSPHNQLSSEPKKRTKTKRKKYIYTCSYEACTNHVVKGGVCIRHGAKVRKKHCCFNKGCTNFARKGGVCARHGAKLKLCSHGGCTNNAKKGGLCIRHGAKIVRKICSIDGCTNYVVNGGVCKKHLRLAP
jgi:hypothetical protein